MQTIQNTVIGALEGVKEAIEQRDEEVLQREKVFSDQKEKAEGDKKAQDAQVEKPEEKHDIEKFTQVGLELLDIGIFYG
jgi:hypothetical protein